MVERVVVNRITLGDGDSRKDFNPGDVIETDDFDISEEDVAKLDEARTFRARQDTASPVLATERRSGAATGARDPRSLQDEEEAAPRRRGRPPRQTTDNDEL
jgi:hypothetical protein